MSLIGYAVAIRREDGSVFLARPAEGFATPVWFRHADALAVARNYRDTFDAHVVKVEYHEPTIIGPKRLLGRQS